MTESGVWRFRLWAPEKKSVSLFIDGEAFPMENCSDGFWETKAENIRGKGLYGFLVDGKGPYPDPAGRFMPEGIEGLSGLWDITPASGEEEWKGIPLKDLVIYELHTGTFSLQGTYEGIAERIPHLLDLGINAVEIMPVAQFYGNRNWGYDGVYLYSPASCYGSPSSLKSLVAHLHNAGIAAILDVVYNHTGPVGNYLDRFGPFHSDLHRTPWGNCFNLDGPLSDNVRKFILENVIYWIKYYGFDGLRLDAVHGIVDLSPTHILQEIGELSRHLTDKLHREITIIAETDQNDTKVTESGKCGYGIQAQWNDDFHHSLHTILTGENRSYYMDYGSMDDLYRCLKNGFDYDGRYSRFLRRTRGTVWDTDNPERLVVYSQNHDQIGNRAFGERLISIAGKKKSMIASSLALLSPYTPMIFMGEELGSTEPFQFFIDTSDSEFEKAVVEGRRSEFREFSWAENIPNPGNLSTFMESKILWRPHEEIVRNEFFVHFQNLIRLRKEFVNPWRNSVKVQKSEDCITVAYKSGLSMFINMGKTSIALHEIGDTKILDIPLSERNSVVTKVEDGYSSMDTGMLVTI